MNRVSLTTFGASAAGGWGPSEFLALAGIVSTMIVAVFTVWAIGRQQRQARQEDREMQLWREAVSVLGPVHALLVHVDPRPGFPTKESFDSAAARWEEQRYKWETELRPGVLTIAVGSQQQAQRRLASELSAAIDTALALGIWYVDALHQEVSDPEWFHTLATEQHRKAQDTLEELGRSFRGEKANGQGQG